MRYVLGKSHQQYDLWKTDLDAFRNTWESKLVEPESDERDEGRRRQRAQQPDDNAPEAAEAHDDLERGCDDERALRAPHGAEELLVGVGDAAVPGGEDDGDGGGDEGVGSPDDGRQARAEEALQQRVDPGDEEQRLHHPRLLLVAAAHLGDERGGDDDGGAEHDEVVLEAEQDGLRPWGRAGEAVGDGRQLVPHRVRLQLLLLRRRRGHRSPLSRCLPSVGHGSCAGVGRLLPCLLPRDLGGGRAEQVCSAGQAKWSGKRPR